MCKVHLWLVLCCWKGGPRSLCCGFRKELELCGEFSFHGMASLLQCLWAPTWSNGIPKGLARLSEAPVLFLSFKYDVSGYFPLRVAITTNKWHLFEEVAANFFYCKVSFRTRKPYTFDIWLLSSNCYPMGTLLHFDFNAAHIFAHILFVFKTIKL